MMIRKICLTLLLGTAISLNAQWGGWGEDEAPAKGKDKGKETQTVDVGASASASKPAATPTAKPKIVIEAIGTHYDDAPKLILNLST